MNQQKKEEHALRKPEDDDTYLPDMTPRREGGDDSLAEASPYDFRDDEKVIANKPNEIKKGEEPSQAGAGIGGEHRDD